MLKWRGQPAKSIFLAYQLLSTLFIRAPIWFLLALPRSNRPRKSWPLRRVLQLRFIRHLFYMTTHTGALIKIPDHRAITPGVGTEGIWIPPVSNKLIIGELKLVADKNNVKPAKVPGYWVHQKDSSTIYGAPPANGEKVLLALHGGAYISLSGHPDDFTGPLARGFVEKVPLVKRVLSVEYRLSKVDENPFPAALLDAIAAYDYLLKVVGYEPTDIIIEGDSAGANLALALTRYLVEHKGDEDVPGLPFAVVLMSPWADIGTSQLGTGTAVKNLASDYIVEGETMRYARSVFCGGLGDDASNTHRYISPSSLDPRMRVDFEGFPRTFIVCGGAEFLADIIRTLRDKMVKNMGDAVGYYEAPDAFHDYCCFTSFEPERSDTFKAISNWLSSSAC